MEMLTPEQVERLNQQFEVKEHEFYGDYAYVDEVAVTQRLDEVDPSWSFERLRVYREGGNAIAEVRLTVSGVSRDGIGMADLTLIKKTGEEMNITEPEKKAITDALRRAARLFGIGRYLLLLSKGTNNYDKLNNELRKMRGEQPSQPRQPAPQPAQPTPPAISQPEPAQNGATGQDNPFAGQLELQTPADKKFLDIALGKATDPEMRKFIAILMRDGFYTVKEHAANSIAKMKREGALTDNMTLDRAFVIIRAHHLEKVAQEKKTA